MSAKRSLQRAMSILGMSVVLGACAGSSVSTTTTSVAARPGDAPYANVLVIFLVESFDSRRYLETEIVKQLAERGTRAVRSTSMMDSRTPVNRETFLAMVEEIKADAVLVTQIADLASSGKAVNMNPQSTHIFTPTYYYNVWAVELTEYKEPAAMNFQHNLSLATQLYSVETKGVVWAIESNSKIRQDFDEGQKYSIYVDEATAIVKHLVRDDLIAK